jgi:glycosyltransferase involved in cell wall biosynthesis
MPVRCGSEARLNGARGTCYESGTVSSVEVVIVCSNVSNNCLGRALLLADLAKPFANVRVAGVNLTREPIWPPSSGFDVQIDSIELRQMFQYPGATRWLRKKLAGAKVVVSKPMQTSLGLTRLAGVDKAHLLLDVDDWEVGLFSGKNRARQLLELIDPLRVNSFPSTQRLDRSITSYPHRTVSNTWLQGRFGGLLLPHVRDTNVLRPDPVAREAARAELDMAGRFWVGFVGTPRKHKGVEVLLDAVQRLDSSVGLYLAGVDEADAYAQKLLSRVRVELPPERLRVVKPFDFRRLGYFLNAADVLAIPSEVSEAAAGQIPAKLFDALAVGVPVVVTAINDMPDIVENTGQVVPPGDAGALESAIRRYRDDPEFHRRCGEAARARALSHYSYASARQLLEQALSVVPTFAPNGRA